MSPENAIKWKFVKMAIKENREKREKLQKCLVFELFRSNKDLENAVFELLRRVYTKSCENTKSLKIKLIQNHENKLKLFCFCTKC